MRAMTEKDMQDIRANFPLNDCLSAPDLTITPETAAAFDSLIDATLRQGLGNVIDYQLPYPKYLFLEYLARTRGWMLHGTLLRDLPVIQPIRKSTDAREFGAQDAIYGTQDPLWALFFAVLDRENLLGSIWNGAIQLQAPDGSVLRRYYYCVNADSLRATPWRQGAVYLLPADAFEPDPDQSGVLVGDYKLVVTHWLCRKALQPLARLLVEPEDFPFLNQVWGYDMQEADRRMSADSIAGWPFLNDPQLFPIMPVRNP